MNQRKSYTLLGSVVLSALSGLMFGGCTTARIPVTGIEVPVLDIPLPAVLRGENDLRGRTWSKAFRILHERLVREYAYGEHKGVDWAAMYELTSAQVIAAEERGERDAWYRAIRSYLYAIPDGNVTIDVNDNLRDGDVGASAGLALTELSDGSVIVCGLVDGGPAEHAGIAFGATVLAWDNAPLSEALGQANILWADNPPSSPAIRRRQQLDWLPRGPKGATHTIAFMNPGATEQSTASLTLAADDYETLPMSRPMWTPVELFSSPVETHKADGGYRYVRVAAIAPTLSTPFPVREFKAAVRLAAKEQAPGLLLDLRGTQGGDASLVPHLLENLVTDKTFYEIPGEWESKIETFEAKAEQTVYVTPEEPAYTGPVVVLIDAYTMGPAESLAGFLKGRENVRIFGVAGTSGSAGVPGVDLTLPGNYSVMFPDRRSLNQDARIQGVSDAAGVGGVEPDTLFTMDRSNAPALFLEGKDGVLEKAIELLDSATWRFP